jgi:S-adenosylmethionine uptake transporter
MSRNIRALAIACLAIFLLTVMDAVIKDMRGTLGALQVLQVRYGAGIAFATAWFFLMRPGLPDGRQTLSHAIRTVTMMTAGGFFFYALGRMPIAELFAITFLAPLFIALLGRVFLREPLAPTVGIGIAFGFAGVIVIIASDPSARFTGGQWDGLAAAFMAPIAYAVAFVLLRKQAGSEPAARIVFMQTLIGACLISPFVLPTMPALTMDMAVKAAAIGALGTAGLLLLAYAASLAEAARVSVAEYTGLVWAALIGWVIFDEPTRLAMWIGAALIIGGCLLAMRGKARAPLTPPAAAPAPSP